MALIHHMTFARATGVARRLTRTAKQFRRVCTHASQRLTHPVVYHPDFEISPLVEGHRFPMPKDALLYARLTALGLSSRTFKPSYPDIETLTLVHDRQYVESFIDGSISKASMRQIGLPWSEQLVRRTLIGVGSAILAARLGVLYGVACMSNGGTHHAHSDHGSGWCIFNDLAVAAKAVQRDMGVKQILMLDLDVHQGDGSASMFAQDPSVFTFSMHCKDQSFPRVQPPSDLDIGLPAGTSDEEYMRVLGDTLPSLLRRLQPELVLYNAGVDVHADDALGLMALTTDGICRRDSMVFQNCAAAGVPVACAIGGGYEANHERIVERHVCLHSAATRHFASLSACGTAAKTNMRRRGVDGAATILT